MLKSFELLFNNDVDHEFLDSVKIDSLADSLIDIVGFSQAPKFSSLVDSFLTPCLLAFHRCIVDDYQMKTVNFKVLIMLKKKTTSLQRYIFSLY